MGARGSSCLQVDLQPCIRATEPHAAVEPLLVVARQLRDLHASAPHGVTAVGTLWKELWKGLWDEAVAVARQVRHLLTPFELDFIRPRGAFPVEAVDEPRRALHHRHEQLRNQEHPEAIRSNQKQPEATAISIEQLCVRELVARRDWDGAARVGRRKAREEEKGEVPREDEEGRGNK